MPDEIAATQEPKGPGGPVDTSWLILQRLEDLRRGQESLKADLQAQIQRVETGLQSQINDLKKDVGWVRNYALSIVLIAVLGLLARSFIH